MLRRPLPVARCGSARFLGKVPSYLRSDRALRDALQRNAAATHDYEEGATCASGPRTEKERLRTEIRQRGRGRGGGGYRGRGG